VGGDTRRVEAGRERADVDRPRSKGLNAGRGWVVVGRREGCGDGRQGRGLGRQEALHAQADGLEQGRAARLRFRGPRHHRRLTGQTPVRLGAENGDVDAVVEEQDVAELSLEGIVILKRAVVQECHVAGRRLPGPAAPPSLNAAGGAARWHGDLVCEDWAEGAATGGLRTDDAPAVSSDERVVVGRGSADELAHGQDRADAGLRLRVPAVIPARLGQEARKVDGVGRDEVETATAGKIAPRAKGCRVAILRGDGEAGRDGAEELGREVSGSSVPRVDGVVQERLGFREETLELSGASGAPGRHRSAEDLAVP
jgi:hypothetical protein